jgi:hypothetical protein
MLCCGFDQYGKEMEYVFEVFTAVKLPIVVIWVVTPFSLIVCQQI